MSDNEHEMKGKKIVDIELERLCVGGWKRRGVIKSSDTLTEVPTPIPRARWLARESVGVGNPQQLQHRLGSAFGGPSFRARWRLFFRREALLVAALASLGFLYRVCLVVRTLYVAVPTFACLP